MGVKKMLDRPKQQCAAAASFFGGSLDQQRRRWRARGIIIDAEYLIPSSRASRFSCKKEGNCHLDLRRRDKVIQQQHRDVESFQHHKTASMSWTRALEMVPLVSLFELRGFAAGKERCQASLVVGDCAINSTSDTKMSSSLADAD